MHHETFDPETVYGQILERYNAWRGNPEELDEIKGWFVNDAEYRSLLAELHHNEDMSGPLLTLFEIPIFVNRVPPSERYRQWLILRYSGGGGGGGESKPVDETKRSTSALGASVHKLRAGKEVH